MKNTRLKIFQESSAKFIGVPYVDYDCWGIVKLFYKEVMGLDISILSDSNDFSNEEIDKIVNIQKNNYNKVSTPEFGDIIVLNMFGYSAHIGIYLYENRFLHTTKKTNSIIDLLPKWNKRIEGFYRWQE